MKSKEMRKVGPIKKLIGTRAMITKSQQPGDARRARQSIDRHPSEPLLFVSSSLEMDPRPTSFDNYQPA